MPVTLQIEFQNSHVTTEVPVSRTRALCYTNTMLAREPAYKYRIRNTRY